MPEHQERREHVRELVDGGRGVAVARAERRAQELPKRMAPWLCTVGLPW